MTEMNTNENEDWLNNLQEKRPESPGLYPCTWYQLHEKIQKNKIDLNLPFQRGSVWKTKDKQKLIISGLIGVPIPPPLFWSHNGKYGIIDGKQRTELIDDVFENRIKMPEFIPPEYGGGKFFKDLPEDLQEDIKGLPINYLKLETDDEFLVQQTFLMLQGGMKLTEGEQIHGEYGDIFELIVEIMHKTGITNYLDIKRCRDFYSIAALLTRIYYKTFPTDRDIILDFVEKGHKTRVFDDKAKKKIVADIKHVCNIFEITPKITGLSRARFIALYDFITGNVFDKSREQCTEANEFINLFLQNITECVRYRKENPDAPITQNVVGYLEFNTNVGKGGKNYENVHKFLVNEYLKFKSNDLVVYDRNDKTLFFQYEKR